MATARVLSFIADEAPAVTVETTHEAFVHAVRAAVAPRVVDGAARKRLLDAKLVYGGGPIGVRGICYYGAWQNGSSHDFIEIAALGEESYIQLAGTTIHELAHSLAPRGCGHDKEWKAACAVLGLKFAEAGGQAYAPEHFEPTVWAVIEALPHPTDGRPTFTTPTGAPVPTRPRPCKLGIGTRGGRSRGAGSGSRMRLYTCACPEGTRGSEGPRRVRHVGRHVQPLPHHLRKGLGVTAGAVGLSGGPVHEQDEECHVDPATDLCRECGVHHGDPCPDCTGRGFHRNGCSLVEQVV